MQNIDIAVTTARLGSGKRAQRIVDGAVGVAFERAAAERRTPFLAGAHDERVLVAEFITIEHTIAAFNRRFFFACAVIKRAIAVAAYFSADVFVGIPGRTICTTIQEFLAITELIVVHCAITAIGFCDAILYAHLAPAGAAQLTAFVG